MFSKRVWKIALLISCLIQKTSIPKKVRSFLFRKGFTFIEFYSLIWCDFTISGMSVECGKCIMKKFLSVMHCKWMSRSKIKPNRHFKKTLVKEWYVFKRLTIFRFLHVPHRIANTYLVPKSNQVDISRKHWYKSGIQEVKTF